MDKASLIGIVLGITAIVGGTILEGSRVGTILQPTAALIVFGGTLGATLLSTSFKDALKAIKALKELFFWKKTDVEPLISDIVRYSIIVRRDGLIALERELENVKDKFLRKALNLAVDGMSINMLKDTMDQENLTYETEKRRVARIFDTAGGFAPTIGIIGAVLGLIHVMQNLSEPAKLGEGISVAFVATIYGVGSANLMLLPISKKLISRLNYELSIREMMLEGVIGIESGVNPYFLEETLRVYLENGGDKVGRKKT